MEQHRKDIKKDGDKSSLEMLDQLHPHKIFLYLGGVGYLFLFVSVLIAYHTMSVEKIDFDNSFLPKSWIISTFFMLFSIFFLFRAMALLRSDEVKAVKMTTGISFALSMIVAICHFIGYVDLSADLAGHNVSAFYLYVLFGAHSLVIGTGIILLFIYYLKMSTVSKDIVKTLLLVSNPYEKTRLEMLFNFWLFINLSWALIFSYFLFFN